MKLNTSKVIILLVIICSFPNISVAQIKGKTAEEKQKNADEKKEQLRKEEQEAIERGKRRHEKIQTKETRKRMKKSRKKADRVNANKKPPLWERLTNKFRGKKV